MMGSIFLAAVPRNAGCGVSGALLACDKWFVQALEGDRPTDGEVYNLTSQDRRHRDARIIKAGPIERRSFEGWSMCGQTLSPTDDALALGSPSSMRSLANLDMPAPIAPRHTG